MFRRNCRPFPCSHTDRNGQIASPPFAEYLIWVYCVALPASSAAPSIYLRPSNLSVLLVVLRRRKCDSNSETCPCPIVSLGLHQRPHRNGPTTQNERHFCAGPGHTLTSKWPVRSLSGVPVCQAEIPNTTSTRSIGIRLPAAMQAAVKGPRGEPPWWFVL